jgi:hypothetical protein
MARGGRRVGAGRKSGQLNKRTIEAVKTMGPVGEHAIGVLVSAMEDAWVPWSCRQLWGHIAFEGAKSWQGGCWRAVSLPRGASRARASAVGHPVTHYTTIISLLYQNRR